MIISKDKNGKLYRVKDRNESSLDNSNNMNMTNRRQLDNQDQSN